MEWSEDNIYQAKIIANQLNDPNSPFSVFLRDLAFRREMYWNLAKKAKKEDNIFKYLGILEGIDIALQRPHEIVESYKAYVEENKKEEVLV